jgi:hypothetical protein
MMSRNKDRTKKYFTLKIVMTQVATWFTCAVISTLIKDQVPICFWVRDRVARHSIF